MPDPIPDWWTYRARPDDASEHPVGVVDGDTIDVVIDQGLRDYSRERVRLRAVDAAEVWGVEHGSEEHDAGIEHSAFVERWLREAIDEGGEWPLILQTAKDESGKFGRYLATVERRSDGADLASDLREQFPETDDRERDEAEASSGSTT